MVLGAVLPALDTGTAQLLALGFAAGGAGGALIAAIVNYHAIRTNLSNEKSTVLLQCLERYINVRKDRTKAVHERKKGCCEDYYRELFDLSWTEFQLWRNGYIDDEIVKKWAISRYRCFLNDKITYLDENNTEICCTYQEQWKEAIKNSYFEWDDPYTQFMNYCHEDKIDEVMKMRLKG